MSAIFSSNIPNVAQEVDNPHNGNECEEDDGVQECSDRSCHSVHEPRYESDMGTVLAGKVVAKVD